MGISPAAARRKGPGRETRWNVSKRAPVRYGRGAVRVWLVNERVRMWLWALACYAGLLVVYATVAGSTRLTDHTPYNHFALLAESWLHGRLDLGAPPPDYAGSNDFAQYDGKWYVPFPAFPALLLLPLVYLAGSAELVRDGQFFVWLAPIGPALLFVILEKLRELTTLSVEQRLVAALRRLATHESFLTEDGRIELCSSRYRLLCELVGATRESVSLVLGRLTGEGLVERSGSTLFVTPSQRLFDRLDRTGDDLLLVPSLDEVTQSAPLQ